MLTATAGFLSMRAAIISAVCCATGAESLWAAFLSEGGAEAVDRPLRENGRRLFGR